MKITELRGIVRKAASGYDASAIIDELALLFREKAVNSRTEGENCCQDYECLAEKLDETRVFLEGMGV